MTENKIIPNLSGVRTLVIRELASLADYAQPWNDLALKAPQQVPMLSYAWVASYLEHQLEPGESWLCVLALDDNQLIGVLPVIITPSKILWLNRPVLRTPSNLHTFCVDFLVEPGLEAVIIPLLLSALQKSIRGWSTLKLLRIRDNSPTLTVLDRGIPRVFVTKDVGGRGAYLTTTGDIEEFKAGLGWNFRKNLRKCNNRLERLGDFRWWSDDGSTSLTERFRSFIDLEASGWKGRAGTAIKMNDDLMKFYSALVTRLAEAGWLNWQFLEIDGRPIAASLGVKFGRAFCGFKLGFDEELAKSSPGTVLFEKLIENCFADNKIDEVNLISDASWFNDWQVQYRSYFDVCLYPARPLPVLFGVLPQALRSMTAKIPAIRWLYHRLRSLAGRTEK